MLAWPNFKKLVLVQLFFFMLFMGIGLTVNFLQLLTFLFVRPFSRCVYRSMNRALAWSFWSYITTMAQYWSGCDCELFISDADFEFVNREHCIVIMNHKYDVDWLMGWIICQRTGLLPGSKIIGKSSLRLVPLIGWCWIFSESIFIQRKWETDKRILIQSMDNILLDYPKDRYFNILMFCEGTRFTKEKHAEGLKVAKEKGLPELKHHLLPRTKGFSLLAQGASDRIGAIYDLTVGIDPSGPRPDFSTIRGGVGLKGQILVRRIPFSTVPKEPEKSAQFVYNLYKEKDEIYDSYLRTGSFESLGLPKRKLDKNYHDLVMTIVWSILLLTPVAYGLFALVMKAPFLVISSFLVCLVLASYALELMIGVTKSEAGSQYGVGKKSS